jgi:hypothetical protein
MTRASYATSILLAFLLGILFCRSAKAQGIYLGRDYAIERDLASQEPPVLPVRGGANPTPHPAPPRTFLRGIFISRPLALRPTPAPPRRFERGSTPEASPMGKAAPQRPRRSMTLTTI